MSTSKNSKNPRKSKKNPSNLNIIPPSNFNISPPQQQGYRPEMSLYSPHQLHFAAMAQSMYHQQGYVPYQNPSQTQFQTQSLADPDTPCNPFDLPFQTQNQTHPRSIIHRLVDESSDSSNEGVNVVPESEPELDPEPEFESQPEPQQRKGNVKAKAKAVPWTGKEVKALAEAWVDVSEDDAIGNDQDGATYKFRVWQGFCRRMGKETRTPDQCYSKWRLVNKPTQQFNGVCANIARKPPSGANDLDIINLAKEMYEVQYGESFKHEVFWQVVRTHKKWLALESVDDFTGMKSRTKRSKTSESTYSHSSASDGRTFIDLNTTTDSYEEQPIHIGRDAAKAKKKAKGVAGSSSGVDNDTHELEGFNIAITKLAEARKLKEKLKAYKFLTQDLSTIPEHLRLGLEKARADILKEFNWD